MAVPLAADAQAEAAAPGQRVEVTGTRADDDRRDSLAAKVVVTRSEITRHGDSSLVDVLRRVPGVTVGGTPGRGAEVRLQGMGNGYTQLLLDGEPVPRGFSLESLSPDQIERIEISRAATVDQSAQAIAGTLNIVMRRATGRHERSLKLSASRQGGRPAQQLEGGLGGRAGAWSYGLGATLGHKQERWPAQVGQRAADAAGTPLLERRTQRDARGRERSASLTPRLGWQAGDADKLQLDALLRATRFDDSSVQTRSALLGPAPAYAADRLDTTLRTGLQRLRAAWTRQLESGASTELRLGGTRLRRESRSTLLGLDSAPTLVMDERVASSTTERTGSLAGKLRLPYVAGHALALGGDADRARRSESREQRQTSPTGRPTTDLDEQFDATVTGWAMYLQDEWDVTPALSVYAGVRSAGLRTRTEGPALDAGAQRFQVSSPVLQLLWKPGAAQGDQLRAGLSRTYRAPRVRDLVPRRFVAVDNTPTSPDLQGNPGLRPELAWGLDLGWEHFLARKAGLLSVNLGLRHIRDVIVERLDQDARGWVATKANGGQARVRTLELESRTRLRLLWPAAPDAELRLGAARHWSAVAAVPGPDNRLDAQVPWSLNLGLDGQPDDSRWSLGASLAVQGGQRARTSLTQTTATQARRTLDLYALWKQQPGLQWRLGLSNALHRAAVSTDLYEDAAGSFLQRSEEASFSTVRLTLEFKL